MTSNSQYCGVDACDTRTRASTLSSPFSLKMCDKSCPDCGDLQECSCTSSYSRPLNNAQFFTKFCAINCPQLQPYKIGGLLGNFILWEEFRLKQCNVQPIPVNRIGISISVQYQSNHDSISRYCHNPNSTQSWV